MKPLFSVFAGMLIITGAVLLAAPQTPRASVLIDSASLLNDLKALSADDMQGRQVDTPGGKKARDFVIERFKQSGIKPFGATYEMPFTFSGRRGVNVVGHIDGSKLPAHYIVLSAHYDHIGMRGGQVANGADDNASGTAALFALARYFSTHQPSNSLIFAAFDAEEAGEWGSKSFVKTPPVDAVLIDLNLNMDMIGREPNDRLFVVGTALQPFLKPFIETVAKTAPLKLLIGHEDPTQPEDWTRDSDHYSFIAAWIPALYFGVEDFAQHHKVTDDYETMSFDFYVRAVETLLQATKEFDAHLDVIARAKGGQ